MRRKVVDADHAVARIAARQHGAIAIEQLLSAGLSEAGVRRRTAAGRLHRIHRGVYAVGHPGLDREGRWKAATLACGDGAALSHRSAAELWGLVDPSDGSIHVTVPAAGGRAARAGLRIHRSRTLAPSLVTSRGNIPVTRPRRTLEDIRSEVDDQTLRAAVRQASVAGLPLDGFAIGRDGPESELERRFLALCRRFHLPLPRTQALIRGDRVDFLWPAERLVVETDGWRYHRGQVSFEEDRARDARLVALGFEVLRLTYRRVTEEPAAVAELIRARLLDRGRRLTVDVRR